MKKRLDEPDGSVLLLGGGDEAEGLEVPEVDGSVLGGGGEQELVRVELDIGDWAGVLVKLGHQLSRPEVPDLKQLSNYVIISSKVKKHVGDFCSSSTLQVTFCNPFLWTQSNTLTASKHNS